MTEIACAIFERDDNILLMKRALHKTWYPGHWDLVGGHVETGESVEEALVRECEEEVGLTPTAYRHYQTFALQEDGLPTRYNVYVISRWDGGEPLLLGDEHTEMAWMPVAAACELPGLALDRYREMFLALRQPDRA